MPPVRSILYLCSLKWCVPLCFFGKIHVWNSWWMHFLNRILWNNYPGKYKDPNYKYVFYFHFVQILPGRDEKVSISKLLSFPLEENVSILNIYNYDSIFVFLVYCESRQARLRTRQFERWYIYACIFMIYERPSINLILDDPFDRLCLWQMHNGLYLQLAKSWFTHLNY